MAYKDPEKAREYGRRYRDQNRDRIRETQRLRYQRKKTEMDEQSRRWKAENPERQAYLARRFALRTKYGITPADYDRMLKEQDGGCAICGRTDSGRARDHGYLIVDHDADNGGVRGLLCHPCNAALGLLRHDPARIAAAGFYLLRSMDDLSEAVT